jgi:pyridoxal phosphate enzyme (YggS family)
MIKDALEQLQSQIGSAKLLVVTKKRPVRQIREVINAGVKDIGENTLQEIEEKYDNNLYKELRMHHVLLHYIGHLQTNKIRKIVRYCDVIQSVDTLEKAKKVDQAASDLKKTMPIFLELNLTREEQKHGIPVEPSTSGHYPELQELIAIIQKLPNLKLLGFMCIGKHDDLEKTREVFQTCKQLANLFQLSELSMGMSEDYPLAIQEGSTMVRLGRVVFE